MKRIKGENQNLAQLQQQMQEMGQQVQQAMQDMQMQLQQTLEGLTQQLQEVKATSDENDEQSFKIIEDITSAIEHIKKQILQLQKKHDIIEKDKAELEKENKIRKESYNQGYSEAEKILQQSMMPTEDMLYDEDTKQTYQEEETPNSLNEVPEDILNGIETMSDDELAVLMQQHPELIDLIQNSNQLI